MNPKPFSSRSFSKPFIALLLTILLTACSQIGLNGSSGEPEPTVIEGPVEEQPVEVFPTSTPEFEIPATGVIEEPAPALQEYRRLTLEYPATIKAGSGSDVIILTLEVDERGNIIPTAQVDGNVVEGEVIPIPNLYETHNVSVEAIFQVANMEVSPAGATIQPLKEGRPVRFIWTVRALDVGIYEGVVQVFLNAVNRDTGEEDHISISAQFIEIKVVDFFGFSSNFVKTSGVVGSVLGVVVGFPFFKDIAKFLFEKLRGGLKKNKRKPERPSRKT